MERRWHYRTALYSSTNSFPDEITLLRAVFDGTHYPSFAIVKDPNEREHVVTRKQWEDAHR